MTQPQKDYSAEFRQLITDARALSTDVGEVVEEVLRTGLDEPLSDDEARALLTRVAQVMRSNAEMRGDVSTMAVLSTGIAELVDRIMAVRDVLGSRVPDRVIGDRIRPVEHDGIRPRPVLPSPVFHERQVQVVEGFVRTRDIQLWDENQRLDIHLNQFHQANGRRPNADELLNIMTGEMSLPGLNKEDQFEIKNLARSIAVNGVRKPPIIDVDGKLLDGNRRTAACYYILNSPDFDATSKRRVEWILVWQLTEHATEADRNAVIVSLNFEPDFKQDWPEYVKARTVYEHWQGLVALEPRGNPTLSRQRALKRDIARTFAISVDDVSRYISMVELAEDFEDYHVSERNRDQYAVKHRSERYFQYFDELGKGKGAGGVYWCLNQDDNFKHLVYDLLYEGKFQNWNKIRDLKYVYQNEDAMDYLRRARDESDPEVGQELVNDACGFARASRAETRQVGANTRVHVFVEWFKDLPVKTFKPGEPGAISPENLHGLRTVLDIVEKHLPSAGNAEG